MALLAVWSIAALLDSTKILIVSPYEVLIKLFSIITEWSFFRIVLFSLLRIIGGFFIGTAAGIILAATAAAAESAEVFLSMVMKIIRSVPVASFIIFALLWFGSKNVSLFISFLMVLPIIYTNVFEGIKATDAKLLEAAKIYRMSFFGKLRFLYIHKVMPYFISGCSVALGLSWKSGIAAEVIGQPNGSIGERLYQAKISIDTASMFAWTLVIVLLSLAFERLVMFGLGRLKK